MSIGTMMPDSLKIGLGFLTSDFSPTRELNLASTSFCTKLLQAVSVNERTLLAVI